MNLSTFFFTKGGDYLHSFNPKDPQSWVLLRCKSSGGTEGPKNWVLEENLLMKSQALIWLMYWPKPELFVKKLHQHGPVKVWMLLCYFLRITVHGVQNIIGWSLPIYRRSFTSHNSLCARATVRSSVDLSSSASFIACKLQTTHLALRRQWGTEPGVCIEASNISIRQGHCSSIWRCHMK